VVGMERSPRMVVGSALVLSYALAWPLAAVADPTPSYATGGGETIHGTIVSITGKYTLALGDDRGYTDSVTMHDGTVITPNGISLETGQVVTITGHTDGKTFDADEIDTDGSEPYDAGPAAAYYSGSYAAGIYPPYVVPLGNGGYYYGNNFGGYGAYGAYGGYGGYGGYYYSNPGYSSSPGKVTPHGPPGSGLTPVSGHYTPIAHQPISRFHPPAASRPTTSGSFGSGSRPSSSSSSHTSSSRH
jgi:hypothetical protein